MNPESQILELPPRSAAGDTNPSIQQSRHPLPDDPAIQESIDPVHPAFGTGKRGNGKVARLPKAIRDELNNLILDGVPYAEIIQRLGEPTKHLNPGHLKEWKKYGYQDWLLEREWLDRLSSKAEFSSDILAAPNSSNLHEAGLRIAASQMFDQLMRFNAASESGASDQPEKFARLVNALSRLTREALAFQKYRDVFAKTTAVELKQRDPDRDLADNELLMLVNKMDHTFKVARPNLDAILAQARGGASVPPPRSHVGQSGSDREEVDSLSAPGRGLAGVHSPSESNNLHEESGTSIQSKIKTQNSKIPDPASSSSSSSNSCPKPRDSPHSAGVFHALSPLLGRGIG